MGKFSHLTCATGFDRSGNCTGDVGYNARGDTPSLVTSDMGVRYDDAEDGMGGADMGAVADALTEGNVKNLGDMGPGDASSESE